MFKKTEALASYFCAKYPAKSDLSKARVNKLIYLSDWKACLESGSQITDVKWLYNLHGPYVAEIIDELVKSGRFHLEKSFTFRGSQKEILHHNRLADNLERLSPKEEEIASFVLEQTASLTFDEFIKLVYSTYPIITSEKGSILNLPVLAEEYQNKQDLFVRQHT